MSSILLKFPYENTWISSKTNENSPQKSSILPNIFIWKKSGKPVKVDKVHCLLDKIRLHLPTAHWSEANSFLPTVQLDFSCTLEMSDR